MAGRTAKPNPTNTLEERPWETAGKLGDNQEPSEYKHAEQLEETTNRYTNRSATTAETFAGLVKLAKTMRAVETRHGGLREDEAAFYGAVPLSDAAVLVLGDDTQTKTAQALLTAVRSSASIDWNLKESVSATMRTKVRPVLAKYDYPLDAEAKAVELVLEQAAVLAMGEGV